MDTQLINNEYVVITIKLTHDEIITQLTANNYDLQQFIHKLMDH